MVMCNTETGYKYVWNGGRSSNLSANFLIVIFAKRLEVIFINKPVQSAELELT